MKVLIVDDDKIVSLSLKTILSADSEFEVVGIGNNGNDAITLFEETTPDILLMDIRMEIKNGLEAATEILSKHPNALILFLTTFSDDEYILKALSLGAKGYLLKQDFESIAPALKAVYSGQSVFGGEIISKIPNFMNSTIADEHQFATEFDISEKELEIISAVADGKNNKEISTEFFLSEGTVRNYISNILFKLNLRDRTQLAVFYYKHLHS